MDQCGPCNFRHENTRAIKFCITCQEPQCKTCSEIHKSSKATRNHLLVHITELNKDSTTNKDLEKLQRCNDHPEKYTEYYCIEHKHVLCSTCLLNIQKLNCKDIVEIETAGEQLIKSKFYEQVKTDLENTTDHCKNEVRKIQNLKEISRKERQELQKFVGDLRYKLITVFDKCEKEILDEIETNIKAQTASLNVSEESLTKALNIAEENKNILQTITSSGSKADVFRCALSVTQQLSDVKIDDITLTTKLCTHSVKLSPALVSLLESVDTSTVLQCKTSEDNKTFTHSPNRKTNMKGFLEAAKQVTLNRDKDRSNDYACSSADAETEENTANKIVDKWPSGSSKHHADLSGHGLKLTASTANVTQTNKDNIKIVHTTDVTVCTPDGKQPVIVDMVKLNDGCLVLSDNKCSRLIRLNKDLAYKETADLSHAPGNLTVLDERFLVVCLPTANRVAFVTVSVEFKWMRNFKTIYSPKGVHAIDTKRLLVSAVDDSTKKWYLQILTTDGGLLQDIGKSRSILDAERISTLKLSTSSDRSYLQCCKKSNALFCFDATGKEDFKYNVVSPNGMYADNAGKIFVLGSAGVLHVLSNKGKLLQMVDVPSEASGITGNKKMDILYISRQNAPIISVYNIKC